MFNISIQCLNGEKMFGAYNGDVHMNSVYLDTYCHWPVTVKYEQYLYSIGLALKRHPKISICKDLQLFDLRKYCKKRGLWYMMEMVEMYKSHTRSPAFDPLHLTIEDCITCGSVDKWTRLKCGHAFELDSFLPWWEKKKTCPICREKIPPIWYDWEETPQYQSGIIEYDSEELTDNQNTMIVLSPRCSLVNPSVSIRPCVFSVFYIDKPPKCGCVDLLYMSRIIVRSENIYTHAYTLESYQKLKQEYKTSNIIIQDIGGTMMVLMECPRIRTIEF